MTVVGTRPEIIRLSRVLVNLDRNFDHVLVHTGQNYDYELSQIFFDELELRKPNYFLNAASGLPCETIGNIISSTEKLIKKVMPDAFLILGDTNSCFSAYSAKRYKIPIFHMEAGNRCFDQRVPEEINRKIIDHISDINLPYSSIAREYLLREGIPPERIIKTGSPMYEVINYYLPKINKSSILDKLDLKEKGYFIVSCHREENINAKNKFKGFVQMLFNLANDFGKKVIVTTHPRTKIMLENQKIKMPNFVEFHAPFGFFDYIKLQLNAYLTISDSGTITEESSILQFPALNIRDAHERPEGMEEAAVMMTGFNYDNIKKGISILDNYHGIKSPTINSVSDYYAPFFSHKITRIIISYIDYVNFYVWHK